MKYIIRDEQSKTYKTLKFLSRGYKIFGVILLIVAFGLLGGNISPDLLYRIDPGAIDDNTATLINPIIADDGGPLKVSTYDQDVLGTGKPSAQKNYSSSKKLPPVDPKLPKDMTLIIPKIGVYAKVNIGADGETELDKGVWMPEGFGNPTLEGNKMLFASHRFGLLSWSSQFRGLNSFYRLPELEPGDEIIVAYQQRAFKYTVSEKYNSTELNEIKGDILLYTCMYFRGKERVIINANRVI